MALESLLISYFTWTICLSDLVISCTLIFTAFVVIAVEDAKRPNVTIGASTTIPFFIFFHILKTKLYRDHKFHCAISLYQVLRNNRNTDLALAYRVRTVRASLLAIDLTWTVWKLYLGDELWLKDRVYLQYIACLLSSSHWCSWYRRTGSSLYSWGSWLHIGRCICIEVLGR